MRKNTRTPPSPISRYLTAATNPPRACRKEKPKMSHQHEIKKTHISIVEYDDVVFTRLGIDRNYFGEGNSKGRVLEYDFEYCLDCGLRLLNGQPIMTKGILEYEFERFVSLAKRGNYVSTEQTTVQHSDFESLQNLIKNAVEFGKLRTKNCQQ